MWTEFLISNLKLHIDVSITKRNYLWQITLLTVLIGGIGGWAYYSVFPHHYFGGYPLIPIFFLTFGVFMIYLIYDSWFFFTFEANRMLKKKKRKENETIA